MAAALFPELDREKLEAQLDEGIPIIAAAFRGGAAGPDELGLDSDDSHQRVVRDLTALVLRFIDAPV